MKKELEINDILYMPDTSTCSIMGFKVTSENKHLVEILYNVQYFKSYCMARNVILNQLLRESKSLVEKRQKLMKTKKKDALVLGD
jgi:hypothetical protein